MGHPQIASVAEPWILLPLVYSRRLEGTVSEYSHALCFDAINDFINNLPEKDEDYYSSLRLFVRTLYEKQCRNSEAYFLDKTPRYYHIIPEIARIFPDAKFLFLFRNPVHVYSSIIKTWCRGRLRNLYHYELDLTVGVRKLSEGYSLLTSKSFALQYESFVLNPEKSLRDLCQYLEVEYHADMIETFAEQDTKGRFGDPTGVLEYGKIEARSLEKWKSMFDTRFRRRVLHRYVSGLDAETLAVQGYSKNEVLKDVRSLPVRLLGRWSDPIDLLYAKLVRYIKPNLWFASGLKLWARDRFLQ